MLNSVFGLGHPSLLHPIEFFVSISQKFLKVLEESLVSLDKKVQMDLQETMGLKVWKDLQDLWEPSDSREC